MDALRPDRPEALAEIVAQASAHGRKLMLRGGGSKERIGAPTPDAIQIDMRGFAGVIDYDPAELVLSVGAGTPLAEVEALVAAQGQMLAFDPFDPALLLGGEPGRATIGGTVMAGIAGSSRLTRGGARDHLLGFEGVSGRGERFRAGAKVVKNVTGYDLPKLMAGSWGRLAALTMIHLKVVPRPALRQTFVVPGLAPAEAIAAMAAALGSPAELSAAAHLPEWHGQPLTLFRLDGVPPSVAARTETLRHAVRAFGTVEAIESSAGEHLWQAVRDASPLPRDLPLWRIIVAPSRAAALVEALPGADWLFDWAGGLVWMASGIDPARLRAAVEQLEGHAMLFRADPAMRVAVPALHPAPAPLAALETRVRRSFDPAGIFETGRF